METKSELVELHESELDEVAGGLALVSINAPVTNVVQLNLAVLSGGVLQGNGLGVANR